MKEKPTIVVAGASGFVGRQIPIHLAPKARLIGLSRSPQRAAQRASGYALWRGCDLFSRRQAMEALEGADVAIYLVHSMLPSARLTQGSFRDMDLICADNFARAARRHKIERILYVGELIPAALEGKELPEHLKSRLEVEAALGAYGAHVVTLRPGVVIGAGSALTEGFRRLVHRLPVMLLPRWTTSKIAPVDRDDLIACLIYALERPHLEGSFDVGGEEEITYGDLLAMTAEVLGKKRRFFQTTLSAPRLSTAWVSLFTGRPPEAVAPLIKALDRDLLPVSRILQEEMNQKPRRLRESLEQALVPRERGLVKVPGATTLSTRRAAGEVRSVQRLPLPAGRSARWVAEEYARWLPAAMKPVIAVDSFPSEDPPKEAKDEKSREKVWEPQGEDLEPVPLEGTTLHFRIRPLPFAILKLTLDRDVSHPDRHLFWISGGILARPHDPGRLEFRTLLEGEYCMAAIHQFRPRLPWFMYRLTQALIHALVMAAFGRHLRGLKKRIE